MNITTPKASTTVLAAPRPESVTLITTSQNNVNQLASTGSVSRLSAVDPLTPNLGTQLNSDGTARLPTQPTTLKTGNYRQTFRRQT
jgi:hypothetical protein